MVSSYNYGSSPMRNAVLHRPFFVGTVLTVFFFLRFMIVMFPPLCICIFLYVAAPVSLQSLFSPCIFYVSVPVPLHASFWPYRTEHYYAPTHAPKSASYIN